MSSQQGKVVTDGRWIEFRDLTMMELNKLMQGSSYPCPCRSSTWPVRLGVSQHNPGSISPKCFTTLEASSRVSTLTGDQLRELGIWQ